MKIVTALPCLWANVGWRSSCNATDNKCETSSLDDTFFSVLRQLFLNWLGTVQCINVSRYFILHVLFLDTFISFVILITTWLTLFCFITNFYASQIIQHNHFVHWQLTIQYSCWWDPPLSHPSAAGFDWSRTTRHWSRTQPGVEWHSMLLYRLSVIENT